MQQQAQVSLRHMNALAKKLKQRRADAGALSLASPEVKFQLDTDTQDPLDVGMYQVRTKPYSHTACPCSRCHAAARANAVLRSVDARPLAC